VTTTINNSTISSKLKSEGESKKNNQNCFVLFEKSYLNKMKEQIDCYESKNYTVKDVSTINETFNEKEKFIGIEKNDEPKIQIENRFVNFAPRIKIADKNYETKTEAEKGNTQSNLDEEIIKTWLLNLGMNEIKNINFKQDEVHELKNGYI
jgi:hypothetical protein